MSAYRAQSLAHDYVLGIMEELLIYWNIMEGTPHNKAHGKKRGQTHSLIEVHVVGDDLDVGMEDVVLLNHLLQDVSDAGREDQQRDLLLRQTVEKHFVAIPEEITHTKIKDDTRTNNTWFKRI